MPSKALLQSVQLKWVAAALHFEKLVLKKGKLIGYFNTSAKDDFFASDGFSNLLSRLQGHSKKGFIKERKQGESTSLLLTFESMESVESALICLRELSP
jgi:transcription-repair coupling factor (superfamily II helicase)